MMSRIAASVCFVAFASAGCSLSGGTSYAVRDFVDLTHTFDATTLYWPTEDGFVHERGIAGTTEGGWYYEAHGFKGPEHGGTHLDAPIHFAEGQATADELAPARLSGPGVVVDVRDAVAGDPDYLVGVADFEAWEAQHGVVYGGSVVLVRTGFGEVWPDRARYLGTELRGTEGVANLHFPGLDEAAARWLVARGIHAVGIDTASIDRGQSKDFAAHRVLGQAGIPVYENVANLSQLPARGAYIIALPMKIGGGSGAPLRIVAELPDP